MNLQGRGLLQVLPLLLLAMLGTGCMSMAATGLLEPSTLELAPTGHYLIMENGDLLMDAQLSRHRSGRVPWSQQRFVRLPSAVIHAAVAPASRPAGAESSLSLASPGVEVMPPLAWSPVAANRLVSPDPRWAAQPTRDLRSSAPHPVSVRYPLPDRTVTFELRRTTVARQGDISGKIAYGLVVVPAAIIDVVLFPVYFVALQRQDIW